MPILYLGQTPYQWQVHRRYPFDYQEVYVQALEDPEQLLRVDVLDESVLSTTLNEVLAPKSVKAMVDYALKKGWTKGQTMRLRMAVNQVYPVYLCLEEERLLALEVARHSNLPLSNPLDYAYRLQLFLQTEVDLGFSLPHLLKYLYLYLGDGGFGPDYGFFPIEQSRNPETYRLGEAKATLSSLGIAPPLAPDFDGMLPFLHWGSGIFSLLDCLRYPYKVYTLDPNLKGPEGIWLDCLWEHAPSLELWLRRWMQGDAHGKALWLDMYRIKGLIK